MLKEFVQVSSWSYGSRISFSSYGEVISFLSKQDLDSLKSKLNQFKENTVEKHDKTWIAKGSITREKMSLVTDELKIKRVRKMSEADKIVIDDSVVNTYINDKLSYVISAPINIVKDDYNKSGSRSTFESLIKHMDKYVGDKIIIFESTDYSKTKDHLSELIKQNPDYTKATIESFYEVKGLHRTMGWGDSRYITTNDKINDFLNSFIMASEKNNGILMSEFFRTADADNAALDFETYETIKDMVKSRDRGNALMGLEVLSNCLIPEGNEALIALVFKSYYEVHGNNKQAFTPSIWSFIKRNKAVHDLSNNNYRYLIPKLMKLDNSDDMKNVINKMFVEEVNKNYFKGESLQVTNISFNN